MPLGLAEKEQLHLELNSEQSTSQLCTLQMTKGRQDLAARLGYETLVVGVLEQLHVESKSEHSRLVPHSQTHVV